MGESQTERQRLLGRQSLAHLLCVSLELRRVAATETVELCAIAGWGRCCGGCLGAECQRSDDDENWGVTVHPAADFTRDFDFHQSRKEKGAAQGTPPPQLRGATRNPRAAAPLGSERSPR